MEDLDPPRIRPGAADSILRTLDGFGFEWDGPVIWQSTRSDAYLEAFEHLRTAGMIFPCACSRKEIADSSLRGAGGPVYPGTCREGIGQDVAPRSFRVRAGGGPIRVVDGLQEPLVQDIAVEVGDFVVRRAEGHWAYQLAVVVDDAWQQVSDVVRGADLLPSTPRQMYLQQLLNLPAPRYLHLPVATDASGNKLSKQAQNQPLSCDHAAAWLIRALTFLQQEPPLDLALADTAGIWEWVVANWNLNKLRGVGTQRAAHPFLPPTEAL